MTLFSFPCFAPLQSKKREQRKSQTSTSRIKVAETLVNFMLAVLGAHLRPECSISTPKNRETPVIFVLAVLGAHSRFGAGLRRRPQIDRKRLRPNLGQPPITATLETFDESAAQNVRDAEVPSLQGPGATQTPKITDFQSLKSGERSPSPFPVGLEEAEGRLEARES